MTETKTALDESTRCPLCHAAGPAIADIDVGAGWRCTVCHQAWDLRRLATVAAYAAFDTQRTAAAAAARAMQPDASVLTAKGGR